MLRICGHCESFNDSEMRKNTAMKKELPDLIHYNLFATHEDVALKHPKAQADDCIYPTYNPRFCIYQIIFY